MLNEKELPFLAKKGHIVSLVGGGGKTTLLYAMADHCASKGWRVVVMTTTHIRQPAACYAPDEAALSALWHAGRYAVIGTPVENGKLTLARITGLVEKAVAEKRLGEDKKAQFIELGKKVGSDELKNVLDAMQPQVKISTVLSYQGGKQQAQPSTYAKLSDVPSDALLEMREQNPEEYKRLYKAEYGMTCEI